MNRRILFVDDDRALLARTEAQLSKDYEVHLAATGEEGLARLEEHGPFAVVVSEQELSGMTGVEFLGEVSRRCSDSLRLMRTACTDVELALQALDEGGIFRFLVKPVPEAYLAEVVRQAALRHEATAEERMRIEQLAFSREGLVNMNSTLERRGRRHEERLSELEQLLARLGSVETVERLVEDAGAGLFAWLDRQPLRLDIQEPDGGTRHIAEWGELAAGIERHRLGTTTQGELLLAAQAMRTRGDRSLIGLAVTCLGSLIDRLVSRAARLGARAGTLRGLTRVAAHRDNETGRHLERVGLYCQVLGRGLRDEGFPEDDLDEDFIENIAVASKLHDIGKVAVPDAILHKRGKLSEDEWVIMRQHARMGAETLASVLEVVGEDPLVRMAHDIALRHHERWDGRGYPDGQAGAEIPLAARIVALADVYDALTTERPYKHAWSHAEALAEIQREAGQHFDPDLVVCMLSRSSVFDRIRAEYADGGVASLPA